MADRNDLAAEVANRARDAAYVAVGLGVLGFQRAQVRRKQLEQKLGAEVDLGERLGELRSLVAAGIQQVDGLVEQAVEAVESGLQPLEEQLPAAAREVAQRVVDQARVVGTQLKHLVDRES